MPGHIDKGGRADAGARRALRDFLHGEDALAFRTEATPKARMLKRERTSMRMAPRRKRSWTG